MFVETISIILASLETTTQHVEIDERETVDSATIKLPFLSTSTNPSFPLLLTNENEDEMTEHEAGDSLVGSIRIIGLLMN